MSWWMTALIVVAVIALIVKRFRGEPLNARDLCGPPVILCGIAVYELTKLDLVDARDIAWIVGGGLLGVVMGAIRGGTLVLFRREGVLWQKYTAGTVVVWVLSLAVNGGFGLLATKVGGMHAEARQMTLSIGVGLLGEMLVVGARALRSGVPFAPEKRDSPASALLQSFRSSGERRPAPQNPPVPAPPRDRW
ncbi:hypothetical protein Afil01_57100 [Actinorhabdospora filicis]|uniref:DUF1453 domain-containing protein n=1 Tax=Actinorhabdospora filicis TaxID=1785913 RepID=A0A9W6WCB0_9ACTN|nr:DUF1453 domain-containing protein [Actinorhabdospora filicis]GLZ80903.1 hypothetical protein Afil01_57100 [Actinorhabdospora filicis]